MVEKIISKEYSAVVLSRMSNKKSGLFRKMVLEYRRGGYLCTGPGRPSIIDEVGMTNLAAKIMRRSLGRFTRKLTHVNDLIY